MGKLTKRELSDLRCIEAEPRPCVCQFPGHVERLEQAGLVTTDRCNVMGHGGIWLTPVGRSALNAQGADQ
jgi:hypothetical protein